MIEVAMFGAGRIGKIHGANVAAQPGVRMRYVVDVNAAAASELAHRHGAKMADAGDALKHASFEAVDIASSTESHAALCIGSTAVEQAMTV